MNNTSSTSEAPNQHYALVFYSGRALTAEEVKEREIAIAAWVKQVTDMGIWLDPRSLPQTTATFSTKGDQVVSSTEPNEPRLSTIVFFDSPSSEQALEIARVHPGVHYGSTVEVRQWTSPRAAAAKG
jgi:hypothetical protein